jgi:hypothetical protein
MFAGNHDARMSHAFNLDSPDDAPNLRKYSLIVALRQDSSEASSGGPPLEARRLSHYRHVPRLGKIAIWLVLIAIACGLLLYLAVWTNLIQ